MKTSTALQLIAAGVVATRLLPAARRPAPVSPTDKLRRGSVSVVIPARNEALRIAGCLDGLAEADVNELLVVDDGSTDNTADVAIMHGAKVISAPELPNGWTGKPHAQQVGLDVATSEWVLFLDADTRPSPLLIDAAINRAIAEDAHVLSLTAAFRTHTPVQEALHASFLSALIYRFGAPGVGQARGERILMNGQAFLVKRQWLLAQGGFSNTGHHMTDDVAFAQSLARRGARIAFLDGSELLSVEMYESATETWHQWGRSLPMNDVLSLRTRVLDLATLFLTQVLPLLRLATGRTRTVDMFLLAARTALLIPVRKSFVKPGVGLIASPLVDVAAFVRLVIGTVKPNLSWRGRTYGPSQTANR